MDKLLELLKDGHVRTIFQLSEELNTTVSDVERKLEYMEHMGIIRKVKMNNPSCSGCSGCSSKEGSGSCPSCMPNASLINMGTMWEVVNK